METRPFGPQRSAAQPREVSCAGQEWLQGPASSGWWGTVAVLLRCTREDDQFRSGLIILCRWWGMSPLKSHQDRRRELLASALVIDEALGHCPIVDIRFTTVKRRVTYRARVYGRIEHQASRARHHKGTPLLIGRSSPGFPGRVGSRRSRPGTVPDPVKPSPRFVDC
jgi:hypothetical protein